MKFDDLDKRMRVFETAHDHCALPGLFLVARLDGRSFTRLTKEVHRFEAPFDTRFRDLMIATTRHLMNAGFRFVYGFTESDEISLLFHPAAEEFGRKLGKLNSILAGEASAAFSLALGAPGVFDCRICQLPGEAFVIDYFRWRSEDAHRNALNAHCYWMLRGEGESENQATQLLLGLGTAAKNELLFSRGVNFNELPLWQRRGVAVYWEAYEKSGMDGRTGELTRTQRRRLATDLELPMKDKYNDFVRAFLNADSG